MAKPGRALCDTRGQLFFKECQRKEQKLKTNWYLKNKNRLLASIDSELEFSAKTEPTKFSDIRTPKELPEQVPFPPWRPPGGKEKSKLMRPIRPSVLKILYVPKDESFVSKKNYLRERYKEKPEDRFYYPYCSSWDFGWRLKDFPPYNPSEFGRRSVIQSSFYRKNASSLKRDPDWYRICQTGDPKNFNEIMSV